jgi:outer membrane protein
MKKLLLTLVCFLMLTIGTMAQTTSGSIALGGGVSFTSTTQETGAQDTKTTQVQFIPSAGYFVADNFMVGLNLGLASSKTKNGTAETKSSEFAVGPFARYYMFTSNDKFAFTGEAGLLFGSDKFTPTSGNEQKGSSMNFYISPGFTYFLSEKWGLDFQLQGISFTSTDPNKDVDNDKRNSFTIGAEFFNPSLGFRYYISK